MYSRDEEEGKEDGGDAERAKEEEHPCAERGRHLRRRPGDDELEQPLCSGQRAMRGVREQGENGSALSPSKWDQMAENVRHIAV